MRPTTPMARWITFQHNKEKGNALRQASSPKATCLAQLLAHIRGQQFVGQYIESNGQHQKLPAPGSMSQPWQPIPVMVHTQHNK